MGGDGSTLEAHFRSFHSKQIIPAAPVKADSRIELSVKPRGGWGGLSASNLLFRHLGSFLSVDRSSDQEIQTWIMLASASFRESLAQDLSNQDGSSAYWAYQLPTCLHAHTLLCSSYRRHIRPLHWSSTCSTSLPSPGVCIKWDSSKEQLQRCISTTISQQQLCCVGHAVVSWELVRPITPQRTVIGRAAQEVEELAEGVLRKCVIRPGGRRCW